MNLTEEQISTLKEKALAGAQLNELQKVIQEEFQQSITYMETRFLISDLEIEVISPAKDPEKTPEPKQEEPPSQFRMDQPSNPEAPHGSVTVDVDNFAKPGAVLNGSVIWSDGKTSTWLIDEQGGLDMKTADPTYQPTAADIDTFQTKLRAMLER